MFTAADVPIAGRKDVAMTRQRAVRVDFSRVEGAPGRLVLNLFDDVCLTAIRNAAPGEPDVFTGTIQGVPNSSVTIVTKSRTMIGTIVSPPATYVIRLLSDDVHVVNQVDPSKYPREKNPG